MTTTDKISGAASTARGFNRRRLLQGAAGIGAFALSSPFYVRGALASSGELNILCWSQEIPQDVVD
ncbi:MAG TPA: hypothetical protein VGC40_05245, partial [Paenirhodobacter sp.]